MKKVALFIPSMYPSGGAERVTHRLATDLSETHDVTVVTLTSNTFSNCIYKQYSLGFSESTFSKIWSLFWGPIALARFCKHNNIPLVISHMERANFISLLSKTPTITVVHNYRYLSKPIHRFFITWLYPKAHKVVTVSKGTEKRIKKLFSLTNTQTIYNYFDLKEIKVKLNEPLLEKDSLLFENNLSTFINVGRLTEQKGQDTLIQSFAQANMPDAHLIIIGEGKQRKKLESLCIELGVEKKVHLIGTRKNIFPLLAASDCFVLSSRWEGFGLVLVEALAVGMPIISTNCLSGPAEILKTKDGFFGELTAVDDYQELAQAMTDLRIENYTPEQQNARASDFSKEHVLPVWLELLAHKL